MNNDSWGSLILRMEIFRAFNRILVSEKLLRLGTSLHNKVVHTILVLLTPKHILIRFWLILVLRISSLSVVLR
jgi:hypothetical protein